MQLAKDVLFLVHTYLNDVDVMKQFRLCKSQHKILKTKQHPHPFLIFQTRERVTVDDYKSALKEKESEVYLNLLEELSNLRMQEAEASNEFASFNRNYLVLKNKYDAYDQSASNSCISWLFPFYSAKKAQEVQTKLNSLLECKQITTQLQLKMDDLYELIVIKEKQSRQIKQREHDSKFKMKSIRHQYEVYRHFRNVLIRLPIYSVNRDSAFFTQSRTIVYSGRISFGNLQQVGQWFFGSSLLFGLQRIKPYSSCQIDSSMLEHNIVLIQSSSMDRMMPRVFVHSNRLEIEFRRQRKVDPTNYFVKYYAKSTYKVSNRILKRISEEKHTSAIRTIGFLRELSTAKSIYRLFNALLDGKVVEEHTKNSFYLYWCD
jgi:hypothetical protein